MKTITNIVYNFVRKQLAKNNMGQGKGITSLPNAADIEIGMTDVYNNLRKGGLDAVSAGKAIKSEDDLARTLAEINALDRDKKLMKEFQQQLNQDPNRLDIIIDKMNRGIPLNKSDQFALEGSGFKTQLDAFKGFEPKVIQGGKSKGIEKLLESGDVKKGVAPKTTKETIKRKSMIDPKLTQEENIKNIMEENKAAAKRLEEKMKDPDKKAEGGRASYFKGGIASLYKGIKGLQQGRIQKELINKYKSEGMNLIEALNKANLESTQIVKNRKLKIIQDKLNETSVLTDDYVTLIDEEIKLNDPELFEDIRKFEKNNRPDLADKMRALRHPDWAEANFGKNYEDVLQDRQNKAIKQMMDDIPNVKERTVVDDIDDMNQANIDEFLGRKKNAEGGLTRLGMFAGGTPLRRLLQYLAGTSGKKGSENLKDLNVSDQLKFFAEKQGYNPDRIRIEYLEQVLDTLKKDRDLIKSVEPSATKNELENMASKAFRESFVDMTQSGRFKGLTSDMIDKSILETETILKNLKTGGRKPNAEGGLMRLGFEKGGMSRRGFMKLMGGLAALPFVGKLFKFAKPTSTAVQAAKEATGVPSYFPKLVEKIKLLGDDVTSTRATGGRQIVKEYKGYELTESLDTGSLSIKRDGYTSEEYLEYIPGGQYYDETRKKVIKYPDSYEEVTVKPDYEGKMKDVDFGLDSYDEILEEVGEAKIKKAGGGLAYMLGM